MYEGCFPDYSAAAQQQSELDILNTHDKPETDQFVPRMRKTKLTLNDDRFSDIIASEQAHFCCPPCERQNCN